MYLFSCVLVLASLENSALRGYYFRESGQFKKFGDYQFSRCRLFEIFFEYFFP